MGSEIVILVVGDEKKEKSALADELASKVGASYVETTTAGVRTFTGTSRSSWTIVDTTPFLGGEGVAFKNARQWISQNSLRRLLYKKYVFVVCVVSSSTALPMANMSEIHKFGWLDSLGVIFKEHKGGVKICVNTTQVDEVDMAYMKHRIEYILSWHGFTAANNITYTNLAATGVALAEELVNDYQEILRKSRERKGVTIVPFLLDQGSDRTKRESFGSWPERIVLFGSYGPWGPERVVLFGSERSGKTTLAKMLTKATLERNSKSRQQRHEDPFFPSSPPSPSTPSSPSSPLSPFTPSARSSSQWSALSSSSPPSPFSPSAENESPRQGQEDTSRVTQWEGRGWHVVDTPSFVDPKDEFRNRPTQEDAERRIKDYVMSLQGLYSHFLLVIRKDRVHELDKRLWQFFLLLFGKEVRELFSIVVSNADREWVEENSADLKHAFPGCSSFLAAEFPPVIEDDEEWEAEMQKVRIQSLKDLEDSLAALSRNDTYCHIGEYVRRSIPDVFNTKTQHHGSEKEGKTKRDTRQKALGTSRTTYNEVSVLMSSLTNALKLHDHIALLPAVS